MDGWTGLDPTQKASPIRASSDANKCNQCDYASSQASHLRTHLITHSGEKVNKCSLCDFATSRAKSLATHMKKHV